MKVFPILDKSYYNEGMDLRDYFAAKAMQGFVQGLVQIDKNDGEKTSDVTAMMAYKFADAMMEARNA